MANLVFRDVKGAILTKEEGDANNRELESRINERAPGINGIANLRTTAIVNNTYVWRRYHTTAGDGGQIGFRGVTGAAPGTYVDNNGTTVIPAGGDGSSAWVAVYSGPVSVRMFGASGSGDETAKFNTAIASIPNGTEGSIIVPNGAYTVTIASIVHGTRRLLWILDNGATVNGDLVNSRPDSSLLPGMSIWGGRFFRSKQTEAIVPFEIVRHNAPLNLYGSSAALILQVRNAENLPSGGLRDQALLRFNADGDGAVINYGPGSWATDSFWAGLRVQQEKTGGGSAHNITLSGTLGATTTYNELGGLAGFLRNNGSTNGYMSAVEVRVSDQNDTLTQTFDTRMIGTLGGVDKRHPSSLQYSHCFYAHSSGTEDVDTALSCDGLFRDGINFQNAPISRWSILCRSNGKMGWQRISDNSAVLVNCNRIQQDGNAVVIHMGGTTGYSFNVQDPFSNVLLGVDASNGKTSVSSLSATSSIVSVAPTAGIGYATGAGGVVTQLTSKATGVTLNKVCGQITLNNAALAASTSVSFTITNSAITATDFPNVIIASGATAGSYFVGVDAVAAGSCRVHLRNMSAGSLSETLVLNFILHKAVAA